MTSPKTAAKETSVLLDPVHSLTEKPVFECAFAYPIMLFLLSYLVKNSTCMYHVSVIFKLATCIKWN